SLDRSAASPTSVGTLYQASRGHRPADVSRFRGALGDAAAILAYLAGAVVVTAGLWAAPGARTVVGPGGADLMQFEMFMVHGSRVFTDGQNPFFTEQL